MRGATRLALGVAAGVTCRWAPLACEPMDDRTARGPRLRGVVTAALSTLLIAVGHVLAGGSVPDLAVLVVLFPLLTGAVVGVADRCRSTSGRRSTG